MSAVRQPSQPAPALSRITGDDAHASAGSGDDALAASQSARAPATSLQAVLEAEAKRAVRRRWLGITLGLIVLCAVAIAAYFLRPRPIAVADKFKLATVSRGDVVHQVSATGRLESRRTVQVGAEISGRIASVDAEWNANVQAGQVLVRFDPTSLRAQLAQAKAQLSAAQAALAQAGLDVAEAERQQKRSEKLFALGADSEVRRETTDAQLQSAKAHVATARAQVDLQQASYELARNTLDHAVIRAPISGVIIARNVEPGQAVAAALQSPVLFSIAEDLKQMRVLVSIDEADVGMVQVGQPASFNVDAYPAETFHAVVKEVRASPTITQGVVTYEAVLELDNSALKLKPGMTASVKIRTAGASAVLRVPNAALRFIPPSTDDDAAGERDLTRELERGAAGGGDSTLWLVGAQGPQPVHAHAGISDGDFTAIDNTTLQPGARVIVDLTAVGRKAYGLDDKRK